MCRSAHHDGWRLGIDQKNPYIDLGVTVQVLLDIKVKAPGSLNLHVLLKVIMVVLVCDCPLDFPMSFKMNICGCILSVPSGVGPGCQGSLWDTLHLVAGTDNP